MAKRYRGLNKLKGRIQKAGRGLSNEYDRETQKAILIARNTAISKVPVDQGFLKQSIGLERKGKSFYRLVAQAPYAILNEFGTGVNIKVPTDIDGELRRQGLAYKFGDKSLYQGIKKRETGRKKPPDPRNKGGIYPKLFMTFGYRAAKSYLAAKMQQIVDKKR